jgi:hypothetical protein
MPHILSQNAEIGWLSGNFKGILFKQLVTYEYVRSEKLYWILLKNKKMQGHFIIISSRLRVRNLKNKFENFNYLGNRKMVIPRNRMY